MSTPIRLQTVVVRLFLFIIVCGLVALVTMNAYRVYLLYQQSLYVPPLTLQDAEDMTSSSTEKTITEEEKLSLGADALNNQLEASLSTLPLPLKNELDQSSLYFMLAYKTGSSTQSFVFENNAFVQSPLMKAQDLFYSYSQDGTQTGFFAITPERKVEGANWATQAQGFVATGLTTPFPSLETAKLVDSSEMVTKLYPSVSNSGDLLFVGLTDLFHEHEDGFERADDYEIYFASNGKTKLLLNGYMPKWISDTEFVFLKNDGLYKANVNLSNVERIAPVDESQEVYVNNQIDISHDGSMIVWTQPNQELVLLLEKNELGKFEPIGTFLVRGLHASFSPNDSYVAILSRRLEPAEDEHDAPIQRLEFFDVATQEKVPGFEISFDAFNQLAIFFTEWVKK